MHDIFSGKTSSRLQILLQDYKDENQKLKEKNNNYFKLLKNIYSKYPKLEKEFGKVKE